MEVQFFFKNVPENQYDSIKNYFEKKRRQIERLVSHYPEDSLVLHVNVERFAKKGAYSVEFVLSIPHNRLAAKEDSHLITKAIDDAKDRLISQLIDIKERFQGREKQRKPRKKQIS